MPLTEALHELATEIPSRIIAYTHDIAVTDDSYKIEEGTKSYELLSRYNKGVIYTTISLFRKRALAKLFGIDESEILVINNGVNLPDFMNFHDEYRETKVYDRNMDHFIPVFFRWFRKLGLINLSDTQEEEMQKDEVEDTDANELKVEDLPF